MLFVSSTNFHVTQNFAAISYIHAILMFFFILLPPNCSLILLVLFFTAQSLIIAKWFPEALKKVYE